MLSPTDSPASSSAHRGRVAIAMSGGVDSSVAASMLVEQGHEVVGVHMKLHDIPDGQRRDKSCCSLDDSLDARQVCARLGIPFYVVDFIDDFKREVIDYFVGSYRAGRTPNPCVMCNQTVKNALLMDKIREFGCDTLATGHYARIGQAPETGQWQITRAVDRRKDQTYFLFGTPSGELPHLLFPLGETEKPHARDMAQARQFVTWNKPDSQEVCFVPNDYRDFLGRLMKDNPPLPGEIVDTAGRPLGEHRGLPYYTIGQRKGLGLSTPRPTYVVALNLEKNQVMVGDESELYQQELIASGVNWVTPPAGASNDAPLKNPVRALVKIRYAHEGSPAELSPMADGRVKVRFDAPVKAVTPGQAAVFYQDEVLLGGGWIELNSVSGASGTGGTAGSTGSTGSAHMERS